jgi:EAL and modified HD-GYP domain-containing signal transduction protein
MESLSQKIFIGRQAIFDQDSNLFGYELLYRDSHTSTARISDEDKASSDVLLNTFVEIGIEQLAGPHKAFINLSRKFFTEMPPLPFEPEQVVLELNKDLDIDEQLASNIAELHKKGYQLALDNYNFEEKWQPFLTYLAIVKVDIQQVDPDQLEKQLGQLRQYPLKILAEKIETAQEYEKLRAMGFDYFQGYFFSRPKIIESRKIEENELIILRLLTRLNDPDVSIEELDHLIEQDPALSYKILRYINSAAFGLRKKVESIRQAVVLIGLKRIKAWVSLLAISGFQSSNKDALLNAVVRAYMCQALVSRTPSGNPDAAFTVGTLSILDTLMQAPMQTILQNLPISDEIAAALLNKEGVLGEALNCALAYETLDWEGAYFSGCDEDCLNEAFLNSSHEAFRAVMGMED